MCTRRAHCALEDPTALPQRHLSVVSNTLCKRQRTAFVLRMLNIHAAAWRSMSLHSILTALLATAQRAPRRSATFLNAVETLWCDRALRKHSLHIRK